MIINNRHLTALNPNHPHIALSTKSKLFDPSFSTSSSLQLYNYHEDIYSNTLNISHKFNKLIYCNSNTIAAGLENGHFEIFKEENFILSSIYQNSSLLSGDILALSFNISKNMLAASSQKNKLILFNLESLKAFSSGISLDIEVTSLSWNSKVSHILAASSLNEILILDLKQKKEVVRVNKKEISNIKDIYWSLESNTSLIVHCENGVFIIDLGTDSISKICDGGFKIIYDGNYIVGNERSIYFKDENVKFEIEPIFDFQMIENLFVFSFFDRTEILSKKDLFARNGLFFGKREKKNLVLFMRNRILSFNDNVDIYKIKKINDKKINHIEDEKNYTEDRIQDDVEDENNIIDDEKNNIENEKNNIHNILMSDNTENIISYIKNKYKNDKIFEEFKINKKDLFYDNFIDYENTKLEFNISLIFKIVNNEKNFDEEYKNIEDKRIVFLLSKFTKNYDFIIQNINLKDFYLILIFILKNNDLQFLDSLAERLYKNNLKEEASLVFLICKNYLKFYEIETELIGKIDLFNYKEKMEKFKKIVDVCKINKCVLKGDFLKEYVRFLIFSGRNEEAEECLGSDDFDGCYLIEKKNFSNLDNKKLVKNFDNLRLGEETKKNNVYTETNLKKDENNMKKNDNKTIFNRNESKANILQRNENNNPKRNENNNPKRNENNNPISNENNNLKSYESKPNILPNSNILPSNESKPNILQRNENINKPVFIPKINNQADKLPSFIPSQNKLTPNFSSKLNIPSNETNLNNDTGEKQIKKTYGQRKIENTSNFGLNQKQNNEDNNKPNLIPKMNHALNENLMQRPVINQNIKNNPKPDLSKIPSVPKPTIPFMAKNEEKKNTIENEVIKVNNLPENNNDFDENSFNLISEKISFLKEIALSKKGILIKNKINSANKRLDYFFNCDRNIFGDKKFIGDLSNLLCKVDINEIKNGSLEELKSEFNNIKTNCDKIAREYQNGCEVWLPGFVSILQVVLCDK